jgi:hypothetical protein
MFKIFLGAKLKKKRRRSKLNVRYPANTLEERPSNMEIIIQKIYQY